jgi:hypothetical protein
VKRGMLGARTPLPAARNPSSSGGFLTTSATTSTLLDGLRAMDIVVLIPSLPRSTHPTSRRAERIAVPNDAF